MNVWRPYAASSLVRVIIPTQFMEFISLFLYYAWVGYWWVHQHCNIKHCLGSTSPTSLIISNCFEENGRHLPNRTFWLTLKFVWLRFINGSFSIQKKSNSSFYKKYIYLRAYFFQLWFKQPGLLKYPVKILNSDMLQRPDVINFTRTVLIYVLQQSPVKAINKH